MAVTQLKMAHYDVYTLIKIGIDRRGLLSPLPHVFIAKQAKYWSGAYGTAARTYLPSHPYIVCGNSLGVWFTGTDDLKICHGITCRSCYFPESVSYRAMGCSILSLHHILLIIIILIIFIINFFILWVFSEYTEAVTTSLLPIDAILPENCTFIIGFSC